MLQLMKQTAPWVFGFVLTFAFVLLLVSFRSIVIAAKAIVLNLLSVGAAYGVVVAVFQYGWGERLLSFQSNSGIAQWLPIFMFVILLLGPLLGLTGVQVAARLLDHQTAETPDHVPVELCELVGVVAGAEVVAPAAQDRVQVAEDEPDIGPDTATTGPVFDLVRSPADTALAYPSSADRLTVGS